jgi:uncharacterized membrane protein YgcG
MKTKILIAAIAVLAAFVALPFAHATWPFGNASSVFGPASCTQCRGQIPLPDTATRAFLTRYTQVTNKNNFGSYQEYIQPGSKVIVCNASHCVTYQMTDSRDWNGTSREPITTSPPARGGGGNGNGNGGGGGGGGYTGPISGGSHGGGGGGGSGKVTVGPAKPSRPTHED